ncbi:MAG TPA: MBL fold metallo-hydrolase [Candidatus Acidoferrales bacterium]|nr:MBL fold metallo-hydrolase [Candidatus Acidoferrales bacterium]
MRIGSNTLLALETGHFYLDGGAMFGVVPKPLWSKTNPADDRNRIDLALRVLLIMNDKQRIMVDTGIGEGWNDKFIDIYGVDHSKSALQTSLRKINLTAEDITDVILTHLHFDHVGGATFTDNDGSIKPTFPNANYYVQKKHYEWATKPSEKDQASFVKEKYLPLYRQGRLKLLDGETELFPGIFIRLSDGHTVAQQTVLVTDGKKTLYHPGDMIPTSSHVPLPFIMGYDNFPLITLEEKKSILARAVEQNWVVFFEHDPKCAASTVEKTEKGFRAGNPVGLSEGTD